MNGHVSSIWIYDMLRLLCCQIYGAFITRLLRGRSMDVRLIYGTSMGHHPWMALLSWPLQLPWRRPAPTFMAASWRLHDTTSIDVPWPLHGTSFHEWMIHGAFMDVPWTLHGHSMWRLHGTCHRRPMSPPWLLHGTSMAPPWTLHGEVARRGCSMDAPWRRQERGMEEAPWRRTIKHWRPPGNERHIYIYACNVIHPPPAMEENKNVDNRGPPHNKSLYSSVYIHPPHYYHTRNHSPHTWGSYRDFWNKIDPTLSS